MRRLMTPLLWVAGLAFLLAMPGRAWAGYWELYRVDYEKSPQDRENIERVADNTGGALVIRATFRNPTTKEVIDSWTSSFTWGKLPRALVPGNQLALTITQAVTYVPKVDVGYHTSIVGMRVQQPTDSGWTEGPIPGDTQNRRGLEIHSRMPEPTSQRFTPSFVVPEGRKAGELIGPAVWVWHAGQIPYKFRYVYIWRTSNPPADPGPGIPPATPWDGKGQPPTDPTGDTRTTPSTTTTDNTTTSTTPRDTTTPSTTTSTTTTTRTPTADAPSDPRAPQVSSSTMTLIADRRNCAEGAEVWLPLWLVNARDAGNLNVRVTYDAAVVRPTGSVVKGNLLGEALFEANPRDGEVLVGFAARRGINGDGTVAQIRFKAVGAPGSESPIGLTITTVNSSTGQPLRVATVDGLITVLSPDGRLPNDANNDNKVDLGDALSALKMSVKLIPEDLICDADSDGTVTSNDARIIFQKVAQR